MKIHLSVTILAFATSFPLHGAITLSEILFNPAGPNDGTAGASSEFIELAGTPGELLAGYILSDGDWALQIPAGETIPSSGLYLVGFAEAEVSGASLNLNLTSATFTSAGSGLIGLTNSGETVSLFDSSGNFVEGVHWANPSATNIPSGSLPIGTTNITFPTFNTTNYPDAGNTGSGESIARLLDGSWDGSGDFDQNLGTPATETVLTTPGSANQVIPEPSSLILSLVGGLFLLQRKRMKL